MATIRYQNMQYFPKIPLKFRIKILHRVVVSQHTDMYAIPFSHFIVKLLLIVL